MRKPDLKNNWRSYLLWVTGVLAAGIILWGIVPGLASFMDGIRNAFILLIKALLPVGWAMVIAYLLRPLASWLERRVFAVFRRTLQKALSTLVVALLFFGAVFALSYWVLPMLIQSAAEAIERLPGVITPWISASPHGALIGEIWRQIQDFLDESMTISAKTLLVTAGQIGQGLMTMIIALYMLHQRKELHGAFRNVAEPWLGDRYERFEALMQKLDKVFGGYFIGKLLESVAIMLLCTAGFLVAGIAYAPLMALLVGIGSLVPYIGPLIGAAPAVLVVFLESPEKLLPLAVVLAVVFLADGYFIGPKLIGGRLGIGALGVIVGVTVGGGIAGLWGMVLGIPAVSVIRMAVLAMTYHKKKRNREREDDGRGLHLPDDH